MAGALVGGAFLSAFLQVAFDRLASRDFLDFLKGRKDIDGSLKKLKKLLRSANVVLVDAEEKQYTNPSVKEWLDELKHAVYVADDILDEICYEALRRKVSGLIPTSVDNSFNTGIKSELETILNELESLTKEKDDLGLEKVAGGVPPRPLTNFLPEEYGVFGRDNDMETIIQKFESDDAAVNGLCVVPIVGMGGIGKTTLARLIYNDKRVEYFDHKAWVCVSENFDSFKIAKAIFEQVTSSACDIQDISFPEHLEHLMLPCITEEENEDLQKIPSPEEIKDSLFQMQDLKAPGPDGFPALFYKQLWPTVGNNVIRAVTSFFEIGSMPREVNRSLIVLIPKVTNPTSVNHFRPISLCNVVYKIISKLLVAKLRPLLDKIISPAQSAFIPNRWIAENQIIVQELLHGFKSRKTNPGLMAIKLDLHKAYDRVNWRFIKTILLHLGFNEKYTNWVLACVSSVSFEVIVNGGKSNSFKPSRGLRQGDPLSPYLFILGQEVLSRLIEHELNLKNIKGIKSSISGPTITHVMYADDIVIFSKASNRDAANLVKVLEKYGDWSGQVINRNKSGIFFSKHTQSHTKRAVKSIMQMKGLKKDSVYLGVPFFLSRAPSKDFAYLQDRLEAKLTGWRSKCLSWAGRKTLITSVAQSLPNYAMSTFNIPGKVCENLDALSRRFWWKPKEKEGRFLAWRSWDKLCNPKCVGGLGFKKAKNINNAFLAKLAWMIASSRDSLCMRTLRAKYKVKQDWLRAEPHKAASPIWKAIEKARSTIIKGACYLIGDGNSVDVWLDPWVPWVHGFIPSPKVNTSDPSPLKVSQLIDQEWHCWKYEVIRELFTPESAQAILSIPIPVRQKEDKLLWVLDSKGQFSVKAAYKALNLLPPSSQPQCLNWRTLWSLKAPERIKVFLWRVGVNALPTRQNISTRFGLEDPSCILCGHDIEDPGHLFFKCPTAKALWFAACWGFKSDEQTVNSTEDIINVILNPPVTASQGREQWTVSLIMAFTLEEIWRIRNQVLHHNVKLDIPASSQNIIHKFQEYIIATSEPVHPKTPPTFNRWVPPPPGFIKINVDAALSTNKAAFAVVARNHLGEVVKVWARILSSRPPLQAETEALLWAVQLAKREQWNRAIFEGDSKICFDELNHPSCNPVWSICSLVDNIRSLSVAFLSCSFLWVNRCCNSAAHVTAKFALSSNSSCFFNSGNLPAALFAACQEISP